LTAYAAIETEQARHAREAADAIFSPKQQTAVIEEQNCQSDAPAATKQRPARVPRILTVPQPPQPDLATELEQAAKPPPLASKQQVAEIPPSEHGRIRTLATHGMTIAQVAEVYAVAEIEIERIVRKLTRAHRSH
jgi:hypothetical protein